MGLKIVLSGEFGYYAISPESILVYYALMFRKLPFVELLLHRKIYMYTICIDNCEVL